ncbi:hypothetical protein ABG768_021676, partial [Culter alburnus]
MIYLVQRLYDLDFFKKVYWYKGGVFVNVCSRPTQKGLHTEPCLPDYAGRRAKLQVLWHLDGNHKLIRWRIVIHGAIDGFSRLVILLEASNNNRSSTVIEKFVEAVNHYGVPSRVRCDQGGENRAVCLFIE